MFKRVLDFTAALVILLLVLPAFLVISILIVLDSPGGIFFLQRRVGRNGKIFHIIKFRTMVSRASSMGPIITGKNDQRITRVGDILRWLKLDELPQLINVVIGNMSFVGPRPEVPSIVRLYAPEQRRVLEVRPGLIGPSQIFGRNEADHLPSAGQDVEAYYVKKVLPAKLATDLAYVENPRLLEDLRLLALGLREVLSGALRAEMVKQGKSYTSLFPADLLCIAFSYYCAYLLRFDWHVPEKEYLTFLVTLPIVFGIRTASFLYYAIYRTVWKYFGAKDLVRVAQACTVSSVLIVTLTFFVGLRVASRTVFIIDWILLMFLMAGIRALPRLVSERKLQVMRGRKNALIVGAGDLGEMLLHEAMKSNQFNYRFVGFVDDNPAKRGSSIHGLSVLGSRQNIHSLVEQYRVDEVLIAIANISSRAMKDILRHCHQAKVHHRIVPGVTDLLSGKVYLSKIRDVTVADLLGQRPIELNLSGIRNLLHDKIILVTGAGGSIGSELCRQIAEYKPAQLICLDRTENYLAEMQNDLRTQFPNLDLNFSLCDITDAPRLRRLFREQRPHIVFHAAAHKHVSVCESNPDDAIMNNVQGTRVIATTAAEFGCGHFVMVSTDKAVNPTSVMGCTKRIAELFVQSLSRLGQTRFVTVRFGNVIHSNGSVVPIFMKQIEKGGPVTVTHPHVRRFFMSIPEAVQLVLQAVTMGKNGEISLLDMGKAIRILDLARELIRRAGLEPGEDIEIAFSGLRPGEKLFEELVNQDEKALPTYHTRIKVLESVVRDSDELNQQIDELCEFAAECNIEELRRKMKEIVPQYNPSSKPTSHPVRQILAPTFAAEKDHSVRLEQMFDERRVVDVV